MSAKPVQVSLDERLLKQIDADPETKREGRSAFVRSAVVTYLSAKKRRAVDDAIRKAYESDAEPMVTEVESLLENQAWPED